VIERRRGARSRAASRLRPAARRGPCRRGRSSDNGSARWQRDDRGSASVLVALWSVVLTMLVAAGVALGSALAAREAVAAAADLAALAGASATLTEPATACTHAATIARENGATLTDCRVGGTGVWVVAQAPAPPPVQWLLPGRRAQLRARAHAELTAEDP
jgi:secretion/DNA translocation related TadE-like protein